MKIIKKAAAFGAAMLMMNMTAISSSASYGVNWKVYRLSNTPTGSGITTDYKTVGGLTTTNDDAIDFQCGSFSGGNSGTYALCDIQSNMKQTSTSNVKLYKFADKGSIKFKSGWYAYSNGGNCKITVSLRGYTGTNGVTITGNAQ